METEYMESSVQLFHSVKFTELGMTYVQSWSDFSVMELRPGIASALARSDDCTGLSAILNAMSTNLYI